MTFIVNTAWKHDSPIDWEKMQNGLNEVMSKSVPGCSVQQFEIDENTHGSVATFTNKEAYDKITNLRNNHRKEATDSGIKMIYEVIGHLKAEGKSQVFGILLALSQGTQRFKYLMLFSKILVTLILTEEKKGAYGPYSDAYHGAPAATRTQSQGLGIPYFIQLNYGSMNTSMGAGRIRKIYGIRFFLRIKQAAGEFRACHGLLEMGYASKKMRS